MNTEKIKPNSNNYTSKVSVLPPSSNWRDLEGPFPSARISLERNGTLEVNALLHTKADISTFCKALEQQLLLEYEVRRRQVILQSQLEAFPRYIR